MSLLIFCVRQLPSSSVSFRRGPYQVGPTCLGRGDLHLDPDDVRGSYLKTQWHRGGISAQNRPIKGRFSLLSASVSFRRLPLASAGVRFRSAPTSLARCDLSLDLDDIGRSYLRTQYDLGEINARNRILQGLFLPILCIRQLPPDSVSFHRGPFQVGPDVSVSLRPPCGSR